MRIIILFFLFLLLTRCGPKTENSTKAPQKPQRGCPVHADKSSPARIARSAYELREACGLSEEQVLQAFGD